MLNISISGGELFEKMKSGISSPEHHARIFFEQLVSGLEYCHAKGVCHRYEIKFIS